MHFAPPVGLLVVVAVARIGDGRCGERKHRVAEATRTFGALLGQGRGGDHAGGQFGLVHPGSPSGTRSSQRTTLPAVVWQGIPQDSTQPTVAGADARDRHRCEECSVTVRLGGAFRSRFSLRRTGQCFGFCSPAAVSAAGMGPVSGVRTRALHCRRTQLVSDHARTGRARGTQGLRVTAHGFARATERPNPDDACQTQTSRLAVASESCPSRRSDASGSVRRHAIRLRFRPAAAQSGGVDRAARARLNLARWR